MSASEPLSTQLSRVLLAFTMELDNEFERQLMATAFRPFLTSYVMGANFLLYIPPDGISVKELSAVSGITRPAHPSIPGMQRWGYITIERPSGAGAKVKKGDIIVRLVLTGQKAQELWTALPVEIEARWRERFSGIDGLADALRAVVRAVDPRLPDYLPVVMAKSMASEPVDPPEERHTMDDRPLIVLLAQALLLFTYDYERDSEYGLPLTANVLRVLTEQGTAAADLPGLSGVSKEAVNMSLTFLKNHELAIEGPHPEGKRGKWIRLGPKGAGAQTAHVQRLKAVEDEWRSRFGAEAIDVLSGQLTAVTDHARFATCFEVPPNGWRGKGRYRKQTDALLADPKAALPHHPMVLGRGGWPDGS